MYLVPIFSWPSLDLKYVYRSVGISGTPIARNTIIQARLTFNSTILNLCVIIALSSLVPTFKKMKIVNCNKLEPTHIYTMQRSYC